MPKIEQMFAFVTADVGPNDEGIVGAHTQSGWMPLVGADMARVEALRPLAQQIANVTGKPIKLMKFSVREDIGEITPSKR